MKRLEVKDKWFKVILVVIIGNILPRVIDFPEAISFPYTVAVNVLIVGMVLFLKEKVEKSAV
jgi:hypothetical protein